MEVIKQRIRAQHCFSISSIENKGGLAMLWFEDTNLDIVNYFEFHIHTKIMEKSLGVVCHLIGFYGALDTGKGAGMWDLLG